MSYYTPPRAEGNDDTDLASVSRSGRVRKKPSKLADFESDDLFEAKFKKQKLQQQQQALLKLQQFEEQQKQKKLNEHLFQQKKIGIVPLNRSPAVLKRPVIVQNTITQNGKATKLQPVQPQHYVRLNGSKPSVQPQIIKVKKTSFNSSQDEDEDMDLEVDDQNESMVDLNNSHHNSTLTADDEESEEDDEDDEEEDYNDSESVNTTVNTSSEQVGFQKLMPKAGTSQSLYMSEKFNRRIVIKNGKVINKSKTERKDKGKTRYTAYMLWKKSAREQLLKENPNLDFAQIAKKLGQLWTTVPSLEKHQWAQRAKRENMKTFQLNSNHQVKSFGDAFVNDSTEPRPLQNTPFNNLKPVVTMPTPNQTVMKSELDDNKLKEAPEATEIKKEVKPIIIDPCHAKYLGTGNYKVVNVEPIDIAAHLSLLGESLANIGEKLSKHDGQIAVSGSISLLLDSLVCAFAPLLCLTQQVPELRLPDPKILNRTLENVSYFMPGL